MKSIRKITSLITNISSTEPASTESCARVSTSIFIAFLLGVHMRCASNERIRYLTAFRLASTGLSEGTNVTISERPPLQFAAYLSRRPAAGRAQLLAKGGRTGRVQFLCWNWYQLQMVGDGSECFRMVRTMQESKRATALLRDIRRKKIRIWALDSVN